MFYKFHIFGLLHLLVFILIAEVLFENHVCEKVSSIKIIIIINQLNQLDLKDARSMYSGILIFVATAAWQL